MVCSPGSDQQGVRCEGCLLSGGYYAGMLFDGGVVESANLWCRLGWSMLGVLRLRRWCRWLSACGGIIGRFGVMGLVAAVLDYC